MAYDIINTGNEDAENILISYPLGPDFMKLLSNRPVLPRLRDDVSINETIQTNTTVTIDVDVSCTQGHTVIGAGRDQQGIGLRIVSGL